MTTLFFCAFATHVEAQQVIHAMAGKLSPNNGRGDSLALKLKNGSVQTFRTHASGNQKFVLDDWLKTETVSPAGFQNTNDPVVVFYYGYGSQQTAVAIQDLGAAEPKVFEGDVTQYDKHQHAVTIQSHSAGPQTFTLDDHTVVDTPDGVVSGVKFHPSKRKDLKIVASGTGTGNIANFVSER